MAKKHIRLSVEQEKALYLYDLYSGTYRSLLPEYERLIEEKKKLKLVLKSLFNNVLKYYPECELLSIEDRDEAIKWIKSQDRASLLNEMQRIEIIIKENYSYRSLVSWVEDAKAQIKAREYKSRKAGFYSPGSLNAGTSCKRTGLKD